jgi:hypothetical protein
MFLAGVLCLGKSYVISSFLYWSNIPDCESSHLKHITIYSPFDGWFDQDEETRVLTIPVLGPYEIRVLGGRDILDPSPTLRCPDIWIPSQAYRKKVNHLRNLDD